MSCNSEKQVDIQGHRGCRGLLPENSLPAFEKAIDLGVNTLELDIVISKDLKIVVSHEPYMNPVICLTPKGDTLPNNSAKDYNLYNMNYDDIKQFDCGSKFHPTYPEQEKQKTYKPLLSKVFDLVKAKKSNVKFNIEIKSETSYYGIFTPQPEAYVKLVLDEIELNGMLSRVNLQSFDVEIIREIRKQDPSIHIALLVDEGEEIWSKISQLDMDKLPEIISPYFKLLDSIKVRNLQAENFKVIPWTLNEEDDMKQMLSWQVDGIITDYPNKLIEIIEN
ncbi:glycerophosphodiester phosphodiesterase family protein [Winogradskyella helgolandensis]|uniref:glycerophosphodiester phosphodiesterase family protein n=1 Tax=Winogradskyella helgolandensis TaxID=2697010 RepID=UPI0015CC815D|nr:glycerophosphodiester phosphodiesterase family protein [Winogradskyella helgolandensis]